MYSKMKNALKNLMTAKYYQNCVEASHSVRFFRIIFGVSACTLKTAPNGRISAEFTYLGFLGFVFWCSLYLFCVYRIYSSDQTILRSLYDTKLQRYGDEVERISSSYYVLYAMWKLSFDVFTDFHHMQLLVNIDKRIEKLGESLNFSKCARDTYITAVFIMSVSAVQTFIIWLSLGNLKAPFEPEKVVQVVYADGLALATSIHFCWYLYILRNRYKILNKVLASINSAKTRNVILMVREKIGERGLNMEQVQNELNSELIRSCGKIYGMLHDAAESANTMFGLSIALTLQKCIILIILYLYYFMEATASGLFHDLQRYVHFLIFVFWEIGFALAVIYINIYFCENTMSEAKRTACVTHNIINSEINPSVRAEAVHLSLQITHQQPLFTAHGLCKIDYMLLLEGARNVVTFLVILLQFAASAH